MKTVLGIALPHESTYDGARFFRSQRINAPGINVEIQEMDGRVALYVTYIEFGENTSMVVHGTDVDDIERRMLVRLAAHSPFLLALIEAEAAKQANEGEAVAL